MAIVDYRMPKGWDGIKTIKAIRSTHSQLPVLICTAYSEESAPEIREGLAGYNRWSVLHKPFSPIELLSKLDELLESA